jgi:dTDP-4-amino-4,6-dideoxygalactose transaminase
LTVHTFGCPSQLDALRDICDDYNLFLIEDAAAAFGAEFDGRYVGTYGDIGIVSFGIGKSLSLGDGGMLIINNDEIKESLESGYYPQEFKSPLEAFMAISGSIVLAHQGLYGIIGKRIKDRRISGQYANYRKEMSDERDISLFSYAIGLQELLSDAISKRRATAMYYNNYIGQLEDVYPPIEKERTRSVYTRYFVRANSKCKKRDLINRMLKSGVEPLVPDNGFPISQNLYSKFFIDKIPQSHLLSHTLFGVPNHMRLPKYLLANIFE